MDSITTREKEVLQLLAQGLSTKEIASRMSISFHTVESHRKNLRSKFSARNSTELLMKVLKRQSELDYLNPVTAPQQALIFRDGLLSPKWGSSRDC